MQVTETSSAGLKREFKVVLQAEELAAKLDTQLADLKSKAQLKGFRPGKVPVAHLKRVYGRSIMGDVVQEAVTEANKKIVEENELRLAVEPRFDFPGGQSEMEKVMEAKGDLAFTVAFETLPKFEVGSFDGPRAGASRRRRAGSGSRAGARPHGEPEPHLYAERGGGGGREGRQADDRLRRQDRRRAVRGRYRHRRRGDHRLEQLHSGLRGAGRRHEGRREPHGHRDVPGKLPAAASGRQGSDLRRDGEERSRRRASSRSTTLSPRASTSTRSTR